MIAVVEVVEGAGLCFVPAAERGETSAVVTIGLATMTPSMWQSTSRLRRAIIRAHLAEAIRILDEADGGVS